MVSGACCRDHASGIARQADNFTPVMIKGKSMQQNRVSYMTAEMRPSTWCIFSHEDDQTRLFLTRDATQTLKIQTV